MAIIKYNVPFISRLRSIWKMINSDGVLVIGDKIEIDLDNNVIKFKEPFTIEGDGSIKIKTGKHLILESSKEELNDSPGYIGAIWLNPDYDERGNPTQKQPFFDKNGETVLLEPEYDSSGNLLVPKGYYLNDPTEQQENDDEDFYDSPCGCGKN